MDLYTRTGDGGKTSLIGGRVDKDHLRVEAYGTLDEANCYIGQVIGKLDESVFCDVKQELIKIQHELFDCGGDLAVVNNVIPYKTTSDIVLFLEERIDAYVKEAPPLEKFILPGGSEVATLLHIARTIVRRSERIIVALKREEEIHEEVLKYINRLSDYLFAVARVANARVGVKDVEYERSAIVFGKKK